MNFLLLILLSFPILAVETDLSGNVEIQGRHSWNNEEAKEELFQDWDEEDFYLMYGNLNGKVEFEKSRLEANWFARHSKSDLYDPKPLLGQERDIYLATQIFTFPNRLVARDLFKIQYEDEGRDYRTESELNKLYYEYTTEKWRYVLGRMYINYGQGEIFNPVNPFNQPTGLTSIQQVAQGNDGLGIAHFFSDRLTMEFFVLGNKNDDEDSERKDNIDKTLWTHAEFQYSEKLQLDFVAGEDLNRYKVGGQLNYKLEEAMIFMQVLYRSEFIKKEDPSHNLWDAMFGYDQQMTNKWHIRAEGGSQKNNRYITFTSFDRFLPTEYFIALANQYEAHPLVKLSGSVVNDIKSGFTYLIFRTTYNVTDNTELELFGYQPVAKGDSADNVAQKLVTTDLGMAFRAFF